MTFNRLDKKRFLTKGKMREKKIKIISDQTCFLVTNNFNDNGHASSV